jgi:arylsulfatase A-like enzyme
VNPNILIILVDQFRSPVWLTSQQRAFVDANVTPAISGLRNKAINFQNYFTAAAACTPSRSTLLSGLYTAQTSVYETADAAPGLNPAFPTWGNAVQALNPAYAGNVWWFGKWHLTPFNGAADPLLPYGFRTSKFPSAQYPSPNGELNEGCCGGAFPAPPNPPSSYWAKDADITKDFVSWLKQQNSTPWCATVSLINPHDIDGYPMAFPPSPYPPTSLGCSKVYFPQSPAPPASYVYSAAPSPWNYESSSQLAAKQISAQTAFLQRNNKVYGQVTDWVAFLNWYFWLQHSVDAQVNQILNALANTSGANNTIVVFSSDHGDYGGSHGLHRKGGAAYDEALRVPLYVSIPGMAPGSRSQLCSSVDFFGLVSDLATGGSGQWSGAYPDLARRESIYNFLVNPNLPEQRRISTTLGLPYVLHTTDEVNPSLSRSPAKSHVVCLRTRSQPGDSNHGAKYAVYNQWAAGTTTPDPTVPPDIEFYNYATNPKELGNDALTPTPLLTEFQEAMGNYGLPDGSVINTELTASLNGVGNDGNPLSVTAAAAQAAYLNYVANVGCAA